VVRGGRKKKGEVHELTAPGSPVTGGQMGEEGEARSGVIEHWEVRG